MRLNRYPSYKQVKIKYIGELPEHWTVKALKRVSPAQTVGIVVNPSAYIAEEGLPFIYGGDIREGEIDLENCRKIEKSLSDSQAKTLLEANDLLTVRVGAPGVTAVVPEAANGGNCASVMLIKSGNFDSKWLCYLMNSRTIRHQVELVQYGAAQQQFNTSHAKEFKCPTPPICEQAQIANFLDRETSKIDSLITEQERLIELLQEKRQAVISHAVTKGLNPKVPMKDSGVEWLGEVPEHWRVSQLKYFASTLSGFAFPSEGFKADDSQWKLLRGINVGVSRIRWDEAVYWEREPEDNLEKFELSPGDLVVGLDRPMIKDGLRVAQLTYIDCPCLLLQRVAAVKGTDKLSTDYLFYLLSSPFFLAHFEPETTGVSVPHISNDQINSFVVPIPSPAEQIEITGFLQSKIKEINLLVDNAERCSSLLQERRSALISAAVTGQIDVRGLIPEEEAA